MQAIILCGGLSTRLGTITENVPKILLEIGGCTVLDYQLSLLREAGVNEVVLASGHLHDALYTAVGESCQGIRIHYAREETRLGTGGAIKNAMRYVSSSPFFVLNGDILLKDFPFFQVSAAFSVQKWMVCYWAYLPMISVLTARLCPIKVAGLPLFAKNSR